MTLQVATMHVVWTIQRYTTNVMKNIRHAKEKLLLK